MVRVVVTRVVVAVLVVDVVAALVVDVGALSPPHVYAVCLLFISLCLFGLWHEILLQGY